MIISFGIWKGPHVVNVVKVLNLPDNAQGVIGPNRFVLFRNGFFPDIAEYENLDATCAHVNFFNLLAGIGGISFSVNKLEGKFDTYLN